MRSNSEFAILLFELGSIQVFTKLTAEEVFAGIDYKEVYWQDRVSKYTYGPFKDIYSCMNHYTKTIAMQKESVIGEEFRAPIIYVDFKNKARITYGL